MKVLVYSAIYGGYDEPIEQPEQTVPTDFVMFTDKPFGISKTWTNFVVSSELKHPRMAAKFWKLNPSEAEYFAEEEYDLTIWIDGSVRILTDDFVERCIDWIGDSNMLVFEHPDRDCIYEEADKTLTLPEKYASHDTIGQIRAYKAQGTPEHNGLYACTVIVRRGDTSQFDADWWQENLKWGYQDQISFAYLCFKHNKYPATFPFYQYKNLYCDCSAMNRHKSNK